MTDAPLRRKGLPSPRGPSPRGNAATFLALFVLLGIMLALIGLSALVLPQMLGLLLVVFGFSFFAIFHYLAWGWWMSRLRPPPETEDE
jgi:NhaP-type Na+/H+ or K+/H+ antiporter